MKDENRRQTERILGMYDDDDDREARCESCSENVRGMLCAALLIEIDDPETMGRGCWMYSKIKRDT